MPDYKIYKAFKFVENGNVYYRIVYQMANGFWEVLAEFARASNKISLQSYLAYAKEND